MVRIVAIADTHLYHDGLQVPQGDILVHAGDLTRRGTIDELRRAHDFLAVQPHPYKLIIAGNHELCLERDAWAARQLLTDVTYLEDQSIELEGLTFYGTPWQPAFHGWAFNVPRGPQLAERWSRIPEHTDVLSTHGPPMGIGDRVQEHEHVGCADLLHRVLQVRPRLHLFGHIHGDGGRWQLGPTTFANVTTDEGSRSASVFDLEA